MGKYTKVIFFILSCILLTGCDKEMQGFIVKSNDKMPQIVFLYSSYKLDKDWYETCVVDNQGNIYYSAEKQVFDYSLQDLVDMHKEGALSEKLECIGTVNLAELQDMYNLYKDVIDDKYELTSDGMCVDAIVLQKFWYAIGYNENDDLKLDCIYKDGNADHYPSDERAWDIVNWMNEVMGVETMTQPSK